MYALLDTTGEVLLQFKNDESIVDAKNKKIGFVKDGIVCDSNGTPTRVTIDGDQIVWHGVNPGPVLQVTGILVNDVNSNYTTDAIVVGDPKITATSMSERMIAAAAYWEFFYSKT